VRTIRPQLRALQLSIATLPPGQHAIKVRIMGRDGAEAIVQGNEPRTFSVSKGATLQDTLIMNAGETTTLSELRAQGVEIPPSLAGGPEHAQIPVVHIHAAFLLLPGRFDLHAKCLVAQHALRFAAQTSVGEAVGLTPFGQHVWATTAANAPDQSDPSAWDSRRFLRELQMHVEAPRHARTLGLERAHMSARTRTHPRTCVRVRTRENARTHAQSYTQTRAQARAQTHTRKHTLTQAHPR
jgi:hypothetical protein